MIIVGCDYHPGFQQIAFVDTETGEHRQLAGQGEGNAAAPSGKIDTVQESPLRVERA